MVGLRAWLAGPQVCLAGPQVCLAGPQTWMAGPHTWLAGSQTWLAGPDLAGWAADLAGWPRGEDECTKEGMFVCKTTKERTYKLLDFIPYLKPEAWRAVWASGLAYWASGLAGSASGLAGWASGVNALVILCIPVTKITISDIKDGISIKPCISFPRFYVKIGNGIKLLFRPLFLKF